MRYIIQVISEYEYGSQLGGNSDWYFDIISLIMAKLRISILMYSFHCIAASLHTGTIKING